MPEHRFRRVARSGPRPAAAAASTTEVVVVAGAKWIFPDPSPGSGYSEPAAATPPAPAYGTKPPSRPGADPAPAVFAPDRTVRVSG